MVKLLQRQVGLTVFRTDNISLTQSTLLCQLTDTPLESGSASLDVLQYVQDTLPCNIIHHNQPHDARYFLTTGLHFGNTVCCEENTVE